MLTYITNASFNTIIPQQAQTSTKKIKKIDKKIELFQGSQLFFSYSTVKLPSLQEELFIEVKINFAPVSMNMYNLYYLLSKVYYYRKANQLHAKVVLILPNLPESYWKDRWYSSISKVISNLQETFAPAIKNNLLEIVPIEITQGDLDTINKEIEAQERGSGD